MTNKTKLIIIISLLITVVIIFRRTDLWTRIKRLFLKKYVNYDCKPDSLRVDDDRKQYLEALASKIYSDIYNTSVLFGHDCDVYEEANALCDEELIYVAQHYRKSLTRGISIKSDLETQFTLACDFDIFIAHLSKVGEI